MIFMKSLDRLLCLLRASMLSLVISSISFATILLSKENILWSPITLTVTWASGFLAHLLSTCTMFLM